MVGLVGTFSSSIRRGEMDFDYTNLLKVAEVEGLQDGRLGTVPLVDKVKLEAL